MQAPGKGFIQSVPPTQQANGASAIGSALGNLANTGKNLTKLAIDLDQEKYRQILASSELDMSRASSAIQKDLIGNADPDSHEGIARDRYENAKSKILNNEKLTLKQRNELSLRINLYAENQVTKISTDAKIMQVENGKRLQMSRANLYREQGDYDGAANVYNEGAGTYWSKEEAEVAKNKMMSERSRSFHEQALSEDPQGYIDRLEGNATDEDGAELYQELTPGVRARRIKEAKRELIYKGREQESEIKDMVEAGDIVDPEQIKDLVETGDPRVKYASKSFITAIQKHMDRDKPMSDDEAVALTLEIDSLKDLKGYVSEEDYIKKFREVQNKVMSSSARGDNGWIKQRLNYHNPNYDKGVSGGGLLKQGKVEAMEEATKHLNILYKNGDLGPLDNGEEGDDKKINAESASSHRAIMREVEGWIQSQDKPVTIDQVHEYMGKAINKKTGSAAFLKFNTSVKDNTTKKRFKAGSIEDTIGLFSSGLLPSLGGHNDGAELLPYIEE